ncbi:hypothetical protein PIB30_027126 [Stylosanthes scabra]|uniref:Uncharacterized protein n=1 Tax=Stylosanthes scabra TaxID=79078 RepID=A0ABU6X836_9FABA|nr:hypothetical protein [Stylosanthes scabra]
MPKPKFAKQHKVDLASLTGPICLVGSLRLTWRPLPRLRHQRVVLLHAVPSPASSAPPKAAAAGEVTPLPIPVGLASDISKVKELINKELSHSNLRMFGVNRLDAILPLGQGLSWQEHQVIETMATVNIGGDNRVDNNVGNSTNELGV